MKNELLLYGRKIGDEEWQEVILCSIPNQFERVRDIAAKDGFGHFREATIDLSTPPDFAATVNQSRAALKGGAK